MPNFVSLTQPNLQLLDKSCRNKHVRNSRTSNYIDMKLGPVTKLDERNTSSKKFDDDLVSVSFSQLMVDLEQTGTQIPVAWSIIPTFSLISYEN